MDSYALIPASYVYLVRGNEVLLQLRSGTRYMDGHWVAGAAGHVERGETARAAAVREAAEELGVLIAEDDLHLATIMQRTDGTDHPREQRIEWFWTVTRWRGEPQIQETHKAAECRWWSLTELPSPVPAYERLVLDGIADGSLPPDLSVGFTPVGG